MHFITFFFEPPPLLLLIERCCFWFALFPQIREVDDDEDMDPATGKPVKYKFEYTTRIAAPPRVLCIQLSRFSFDYSRGVPIKHNHRVEFPTELDISKYTEDPSAPCNYKLRGVLVHLGASANSGHYYSIIKSSEDEETYLKFNDNHVSVADALDDECFGGERPPNSGKFAGHEKNWNAYLLFYERDDGAAPGEMAAAAAASAAALPAGGEVIRAAQEAEVTAANADLWHRKLLYQQPLLDLERDILEAAASAAASAAAAGLPPPAVAASVAEGGLAVLTSAAMQCSEVVAAPGELQRWANAVVGLLEPASARVLLASVAHGESLLADDPFVFSPGRPLPSSPGDGAWAPNPLVSRQVLQVGSHRALAPVREAAASLLAGAAAKALPLLTGDPATDPVTALVGRLLGAAAEAYESRDVLEGLVAALEALGSVSGLRLLLRHLDAPAILAHLYLNARSPLSDWSEIEGLVAANGVAFPKLLANLRRATTHSYAQPLHDFRALLRALNQVLSAAAAEGPAARGTGLTALSRRVLGDETSPAGSDLVCRLVEADPYAGLVLAKLPSYTPAEELEALKAEGWRFVPTASKGYWTKTPVGGRPKAGNYSAVRPSVRMPSTAELEDKAMESAGPTALLLVNIALVDPTLGDQVTEALLDGVAVGSASAAVAQRRTEVLVKLLQEDSDGRRVIRADAAAKGLLGRIIELRRGELPALRALKPHAQCARMEALLLVARRLDAADVLPPDAVERLRDQDWVAPWLAERRPRPRITLDDLQGEWVTVAYKTLPEIIVTGDECSFEDGNTVPIEMNHELGTWTVNSWYLSQQYSYTDEMLWRNARETTRWMRPRESTVVQAEVVNVSTNNNDSDDDDGYEFLSTAADSTL